uniref:Secreted protein n=1 Tax=Strombidium rassoulzadegani TaxID=1082188 RepID=A0A7S3FXI8_9SPIT
MGRRGAASHVGMVLLAVIGQSNDVVLQVILVSDTGGGGSEGRGSHFPLLEAHIGCELVDELLVVQFAQHGVVREDLGILLLCSGDDEGGVSLGVVEAIVLAAGSNAVVLLFKVLL